MEWAPRAGQLGEWELTVEPGFRKKKAHGTHSIEFKRQVAQEFLAGETVHGLAKRHDVCET